MATNSILNSVRIRKKALAQNFIKALEQAHKKKAKEVTILHKVETLNKAQIKKIFGE